ncbi:transposable element Tcb2 transposase [Elysia marginata]|uniref:Transposable element Tcb2 transposase n=1 Tax=Elysia marginata TaxID=1093978 RepID=A0AAV4FPX2_9GAST|nr:transposable element Tcb2 transposase [Elysia marginata]
MRQPQPQTLLQLERALHEEWNNLPQQAVQRLIGSMRRRCQAVILSRRHHTRYLACNLFLSPHTLVMCYHLLCHPSYHPDFKQWNKAQPFNWTSDGVHAMHFTHPDPQAFHNLTSLLQASGMFADIGRFIWGLQPETDQTA